MVKIYNERVGGGENGTGKWDRQGKKSLEENVNPDYIYCFVLCAWKMWLNKARCRLLFSTIPLDLDK